MDLCVDAVWEEDGHLSGNIMLWVVAAWSPTSAAWTSASILHGRKMETHCSVWIAPRRTIRKKKGEEREDDAPSPRGNNEDIKEVEGHDEGVNEMEQEET